MIPPTRASPQCHHYFAVLRAAGLLEQRDESASRLNRLRRSEFDRRFPGLLPLVLSEPA